MQPIAGYNYGAQQYERMMRVVKLSIITATCIMLTGWSLAMFVPYHCVRLFTTNPELIKRSINALHIIMMMFPLYRLPNGNNQLLPMHRKSKD